MSARSLVFAMTGAKGVCGGIASANLNVLQALASLAEERQTSMHVLSLHEHDSDRPEFLPEWIRFEAFNGSKLAFGRRLLQVAARRPLICFDHVSLALPVLPLALCGFVKTVVFAHGSEAWKRIKRSSRLSIGASAVCLTNSEFTLSNMTSTLSKFPGRACPLGLSPLFKLNDQVPGPAAGAVDLEACDGSRRRLGERVLLLVARMDSGEPGKGHRQLIRVTPKLAERFPDVQLVFPGPGDDRDNLRQLTQQLAVDGAVFLPGRVPHGLLERLYRIAFAFVMPSRQEGFGLVYLEAMNFAKPCVGCFGDGAEDIIVHQETGICLRDPDDQDELIEALSALLRDPAHAETLGRNGFGRLHNNFTAGHYQERIKSHLRQVLC